MRTHDRTWRAIQITSIVTATAITIEITRRIVRGRRSTTRSGVTLEASRRGRTLYGGPVSLRSSPIVEHAALQGGGSVEVWVGVPDDPYIEDRSLLSTVDVQLREGPTVLASITTVLDPDDADEARELAQEVKVALESGEIGLHAEALEPFADRLRF